MFLSQQRADGCAYGVSVVARPVGWPVWPKKRRPLVQRSRVLVFSAWGACVLRSEAWWCGMGRHGRSRWGSLTVVALLEPNDPSCQTGAKRWELYALWLERTQRGVADAAQRCGGAKDRVSPAFYEMAK